MSQQLPSALLEEAVKEIARLPGIGRKSALRIALFLLKAPVAQSHQLSAALLAFRESTMSCSRCGNLSDDPICRICSNEMRDQHTLCVVQDIRDVMAIENTAQFRGIYHVLGGVISPIDGIGPEQLRLAQLPERIASEGIEEVILALSPTLEGDTTAFYIQKVLKATGVKVSTIARGIPVGNELEYADEVSLGRSILARTVAG